MSEYGMAKRAVILTAIGEEYNAILPHLNIIGEKIHPKTSTIYDIGRFHDWQIAVAQIGERNTVTSRETEQAISFFDPRVILFIGVAGGRKDVNLGDVVVAPKVYDYESGKSDKTFKPRPITHHAKYPILQRARHQAVRKNWLERIEDRVWEQDETWEWPPKVFIKPIASGTKVISSKWSDVAQLLNDTYSDAVAVEMEGFGFLETAFVHTDVDALVVRGISDLIEDKKDTDDAGFQEIASVHASAFAFEILANFKPTGTDFQEKENPSVSLQVPRPQRIRDDPYDYGKIRTLLKKYSAPELLGVINDNFDDVANNVDSVMLKDAIINELFNYCKRVPHERTAKLLLVLKGSDQIAFTTYGPYLKEDVP